MPEMMVWVADQLVGVERLLDAAIMAQTGIVKRGASSPLSYLLLPGLRTLLPGQGHAPDIAWQELALGSALRQQCP